MGKLDLALERAMELNEIRPESFEPKEIEGRGHQIIESHSVNDYLVPLKNPISHIAEEYRKLSTQLFKYTEKNSHNTIVITSSVSGEGKTLTSLNLALTIGVKIDNTVLLIDTDLRNPKLHTYLDIQPKFGLADYLLGKVDLSQAMVKIKGLDKITFIFAGNLPPNPGELLTSKKMDNLIKEVKGRYKNRYVIIDSTPVLSTSESNYIVNLGDGIIFIVKERGTPRNDVLNALALLKGGNILGVVLNFDEYQPKGYYYYQ